MKKLNYLFVSLLFSISTLAQTFDINQFKIDEKENNKEFQVKSLSGKKSDIRAYESTKSHIFKNSLDLVLTGIENFADKCNNEYKERRKWTDKKRDCPIFNNNLVESKIIQIDNQKLPLEKNEIRHYLIQRNIYNRQSFHHYDLIRVFDKKNEKDQRVVVVKQIMLKDKEVKKILENPTKRESAFLVTYGEFTLTAISPKETKLDYRYYTETDHWLLNKSLAVSDVFEGTAKGLKTLFKGIQEVISQNKSNKQD